jgi:hypothetical protein
MDVWLGGASVEPQNNMLGTPACMVSSQVVALQISTAQAAARAQVQGLEAGAGSVLRALEVRCINVSDLVSAPLVRTVRLC